MFNYSIFIFSNTSSHPHGTFRYLTWQKKTLEVVNQVCHFHIPSFGPIIRIQSKIFLLNILIENTIILWVCLVTSTNFCQTSGNLPYVTCATYGHIVSSTDCQNAITELATIDSTIVWQGTSSNTAMTPGCMIAQSGSDKHGYFITHTNYAVTRSVDYLVCRNPSRSILILNSRLWIMKITCCHSHWLEYSQCSRMN